MLEQVSHSRIGIEDKLLPNFRNELLRQFNEWLRRKYGTTERLKAAWIMWGQTLARWRFWWDSG
ncbi:MAG: hypothetical protein E7046_04485 [Lentisphaerae bacterium]|nr:hypothetical protein [Lentisphaerota bacterium]